MKEEAREEISRLRKIIHSGEVEEVGTGEYEYWGGGGCDGHSFSGGGESLEIMKHVFVYKFPEDARKRAKQELETKYARELEEEARGRQERKVLDLGDRLKNKKYCPFRPSLLQKMDIVRGLEKIRQNPLDGGIRELVEAQIGPASLTRNLFYSTPAYISVEVLEKIKETRKRIWRNFKANFKRDPIGTIMERVIKTVIGGGMAALVGYYIYNQVN